MLFRSINSQLLHETSLYKASVHEARQMMQEFEAEKAEANTARQRTTAAFQEGRILHVEVEKLVAQVAQLTEDNKAANQTIVQLKAQMTGDNITVQQQLQQQFDQQGIIASLKAEIDKLIGSNKTQSSQIFALENKNAILEKELRATKESTTMILENGKEQSKRHLEKHLKEKGQAAEDAKAAAA